jgi:hypothetical protein
VGGPFHADSRSDSLAQNFCAERGAIQHFEVTGIERSHTNKMWIDWLLW